MSIDNRFHVLLFYGNLQTGGIQSLIVRLSNWFVNNNVKVTLFLDSSGELVSLLDSRVEKITSGNNSMYFGPSFFSRHYPELLASNVDAVFSFDIPSLLVAILFYVDYKKPLRFINGVYHPDALEKEVTALSKGDDITRGFLLHVYSDLLEDRSKVFMNDEIRRKTQKFIQREISAAMTLPLPINIFPIRNIDSQTYKSRKIVSVGRLTGFKTYNLYLMDIILELKKEGIECHWHIYGQGELEQKIADKILQLGLSDNVTLHGTLPYEKFASTLDDAFLFVGMGTSIIEAGSCGVPVIPAIVDFGPYSYGFLYEMPEYHLGEILDNPPDKSVIFLVKRLLSLDEKEYINECYKTREYCSQYDITKLGKKYLEFFQNCGNSMSLLSVSDSSEFRHFLTSYRIKLVRVHTMRLAISFLKRLLPSKMIDYARRKTLMVR